MIMVYATSLVALVLLDAVWLYAMAHFYRTQLGHVFAESFLLAPAIIFYVFYIAAILYFVVYPYIDTSSSAQSSIAMVFIRGLLFGAIVYAAYDLTNHATIKQWPILVTVVDIAWGAILTGVVSLIGYLAAK
jgi:uncharacterized membrane protein